MILIVGILLFNCSGSSTKSQVVEKMEAKEKAPKETQEELQAKYKQVARDIGGLALAISYYTEYYAGKSPPDSWSVDQIIVVLNRLKYGRDLRPKDPWGNPYYYQKKSVKQFAIGCGGSDGKFEGFHQRGKYSIFDLHGQDVIKVNTTWVYYPPKKVK